jgi:hypothetical protein
MTPNETIDHPTNIPGAPHGAPFLSKGTEPMTLPNVRPLNEWVVSCKTASVGTTPATAWCVAPVRGRVVRTYAVLEGTITTANAAIAVAVNGGADIGGGALSIAPGAAGTGASDAPPNTAGSAQVNEGDFISFTPSGATGAGIPATFHAVIREQ